MKRSKVFLGVTTCLLGVAALAASKAKWHSFPTGYWTGISGSSKCVPDTKQTGTIVASSELQTLYGSLSKVARNLFTSNECVRAVGPVNK